MPLAQAVFVSNLPAAVNSCARGFMLQIAAALQKRLCSRRRGKLPFNITIIIYVWRDGQSGNGVPRIGTTELQSSLRTRTRVATPMLFWDETPTCSYATCAGLTRIRQWSAKVLSMIRPPCTRLDPAGMPAQPQVIISWLLQHQPFPQEIGQDSRVSGLRLVCSES